MFIMKDGQEDTPQGKLISLHLMKNNNQWQDYIKAKCLPPDSSKENGSDNDFLEKLLNLKCMRKLLIQTYLKVNVPFFGLWTS